MRALWYVLFAFCCVNLEGAADSGPSKERTPGSLADDLKALTGGESQRTIWQRTKGDELDRRVRLELRHAKTKVGEKVFESKLGTIYILSADNSKSEQAGFSFELIEKDGKRFIKGKSGERGAFGKASDPMIGYTLKDDTLTINGGKATVYILELDKVLPLEGTWKKVKQKVK
jgi:hypothetical protein